MSEVTQWEYHLQPLRITNKWSAKKHEAEPVSDHVEIETHTWDVLPDHLKNADITTYVTRELEWVQQSLGDRSKP